MTTITHMSTVQEQPLTAFCATCPEPEAVTQLLRELGFRLTFQMEADTGAPFASTYLPPLPAQYHYEDDAGTRIEFLAGRDTPLLADENDEENRPAHGYPSFPPHQGRFWLTPGKADLAAHRAQHALSERWALSWQRPSSRTLCAIA